MRIDNTQQIVLIIDREPSTFKAISRLGSSAGFTAQPFLDDSEFFSWVQSNSDIESRKNKAFCLIFDSQFVSIFQRPIPAWLFSSPSICISRSNKIASTLKSTHVTLFSFLAKPLNLNDINTTIQSAFAKADSRKPILFESIVERIKGLTKRELEICKKLMQGLSGKEISDELRISIKTYYVHRSHLLQKTGARSTTELVRAFNVFSINCGNCSPVNEPIEDEFKNRSSPEKELDRGHQYFPRVSEIAKTNVLRTDLDISLRTAVRLMNERKVSSIVFFKDGRPHIFSMENVLQISSAGGDFEQMLSTLPIESATTVEKNKTVLEVLDYLDIDQNRYLIVVDPEQNEPIAGILTYSDLLSSIDPELLLDNKTIGQIVSKKEPLTFSKDWHFDDVVCHLLHAEDSVIIIEAGKPIGIITARDAFRVISSGQATDGLITQYMTQPVLTLPASSSIRNALLHLKSRKIKRAVIVDEFGILAGELTQSEVVGFAYSNWAKMFNHQSGSLREVIDLLTSKAAKYEIEALTDRLTGLGNRRHLDNCLDSEIKRVHRYKAKTFSKLFIDVDYFKAVNDKHGHSVGDDVLKSVANTIAGLVRENDKIFRWGGDEFAILAPCTDNFEAEKLASRIRAAIEAFPFTANCQITVSIGCGEYTPGQDIKIFFDGLDQALLRAKSLGRNRVEMAFFDQ